MHGLQNSESNLFSHAMNVKTTAQKEQKWNGTARRSDEGNEVDNALAEFEASTENMKCAVQ